MNDLVRNTYLKRLDECLSAVMDLDDYMALREIKRPKIDRLLSEAFKELKTELFNESKNKDLNDYRK